jgi:hypothetical protein
MKRYIALLIFLVPVYVISHAQDSIPKPPSAVPNMLNLPKQFLFIDITQNTWLDAPAGIETKFISGGINFSLLYEFNIIGAHLGIAPGLGYSVSSVKSNSMVEFLYDTGTYDVSYTDLIPSTLYAKSKLSTSYLEIPVEIHIHVKPNERGKSFLIAPGFRAGLLVGDFWKYKPNQSPGGVTKAKLFGIKNISEVHYGISLRLMYYKFGLFGYYSLSSLFEEGKGPDITPVSFGITVSPF